MERTGDGWNPTSELGRLQRRLHAVLADVDGCSIISANPAIRQACDNLTHLLSATIGYDVVYGDVEPRLANQSGGVAFLALLRLDGFRHLSDLIGIDAAQAMMALMRDRLLDAQPDVTIGRLGNGFLEFGFVASCPNAAQAKLDGLHVALERPAAEAGVLALPVTVGFTEAGEPHDIAKALDRAERALTQAEAAGSKCIYFGERHRADVSQRIALMRDLRSALLADGLTLAYQPKLNIRTGQIDAVEALVRWTHPERGAVPPDQFIGLAEDTGDIAPLTRIVLRLALRDHAHLATQGLALPIYINLSGRLVADEIFCRELLGASASAPGALGLEITETAMFADPERALANLNRLANADIPISIDDYGSGLSSLAYLKTLPASELKIDQAFIGKLSSSHRDPLIVRSTIDLAHALGMQVTAEGVDDPRTLALLKAMGCDRVQGYHVSRPLALGALQTFLLENAGRDLSAPNQSIFGNLREFKK